MEIVIPLDKKEKDRIYRACKLVAIGKEDFSCNAIQKYSELDPKFGYLRKAYCKLYNKRHGQAWLGYRKTDKELKSLRITLLLLFAEAGKIENEKRSFNNHFQKPRVYYRPLNS